MTRLGIALPAGGRRALAPTAHTLADAARAIETAGFDSAWAFDSIGRGFLLADPPTALAVAATVTRRIELGTGVLQVPLRNPVELAQRVLTTHLVSGKRLDRKSTRLNSSHLGISYAVFCLKKKTQ